MQKRYLSNVFSVNENIVPRVVIEVKFRDLVINYATPSERDWRIISPWRGFILNGLWIAIRICIGGKQRRYAREYYVDGRCGMGKR